MRTQSEPQENQPASLTPPIQSSMPWRVLSVEAMPQFRLHVCFVDGTEGTFDLSHLVHAANAGVFAVLSDAALFNQVFVEHGAVTWPGEIDLAPDAMYAHIKQGATFNL